MTLEYTVYCVKYFSCASRYVESLGAIRLLKIFLSYARAIRRHLFQLYFIFYSLLYFLYDDVNSDVNDDDDDDDDDDDVNTFLLSLLVAVFAF